MKNFNHFNIAKKLKAKFKKNQSNIFQFNLRMLKILLKDQEIRLIVIDLLLAGFLFLFVFSFLAFIFLNVNLFDACWWAWTHLVDSGFLAEDLGIKSKILGSVLILCQLFFLLMISLRMLEIIQKQIAELIQKGDLPDEDIDILMIGQKDHCFNMIDYFFNLNDEKKDEIKKRKILLILDQDDEDDDLNSEPIEFSNQIIYLYKENLILKKKISEKNDFKKIFKSKSLKTILFLHFKNQSNLDILSWIRINYESLELKNKQIYIEMTHLRHILAFDELKSKILKNIQIKSLEHIKFINFNQEFARIFLIKYRIEKYITIEKKSLNIILYGNDSFAYAIVREFMYQLHYYNIEINIYIKNNELFDKIKEKISNVEYILSHNELSLLNGKFNLIYQSDELIKVENLKGNQKIDFVLISGFNENKSNFLSNDDLALSIAFRLKKQVRTLFDENIKLTKIYIKSSNQEMNQFLFEKDEYILIKPIEININLFNYQNDVEKLDCYPQKQHERFFKAKPKNSDQDIEKNAFNDLLDVNKEWHELNEVIQNWNRNSFDHLFMKLKYIHDYSCIKFKDLDLKGDLSRDMPNIAFNYSYNTKISDELYHLIQKLRVQIKQILNLSSDQSLLIDKNDFSELIEHLVNMEQRRWLCEKIIDGFEDSQDLKTLMDEKYLNIKKDYPLSKNEIKTYGRSHLLQLDGQLEDLLNSKQSHPHP